MEVDIYTIINDPEGYREIFVRKNDSPYRFFNNGDFRLIPESLPVRPQGGGLANNIISAINENGYYRSITSSSNRINTVESSTGV